MLEAYQYLQEEFYYRMDGQGATIFYSHLFTIINICIDDCDCDDDELRALFLTLFVLRPCCHTKTHI